MAWSRWPREGRWFLCLREGKDRRCLAWIESRDEEVLSDLFLSAVWGAASPWFWQSEGGHREMVICGRLGEGMGRLALCAVQRAKL